jgi:hypothetical protein
VEAKLYYLPFSLKINETINKNWGKNQIGIVKALK